MNGNDKKMELGSVIYKIYELTSNICSHFELNFVIQFLFKLI